MVTAVAELELHTKAGWFGMDRPKNGRLAVVEGASLLRTKSVWIREFESLTFRK